MLFRRKRKTLPHRKHYLQHKETAREKIRTVVEHWAGFYQFEYNRIAVKQSFRTWGSCSSKKNLNFNYLVSFLPYELFEYVVVHELCHLRELNHSPAFWDLVKSGMPDFKERRRRLRRVSLRAFQDL